MKYLVNRETKEHKIYSGTEFYDDEAWRVVDADDDGWIKWEAKYDSVCPLPDDEIADIRLQSGTTGKCGVGGVYWKAMENPSEVCAYRPILPAESKPDIEKMLDDCAERFAAEVESKPTLENTWDAIEKSAKVDVFTRLASAVAASESIPALIAEINAMLPECYEVREKSKPEAVTEDMSDWRNWKSGDIVVDEGGRHFTVHEIESRDYQGEWVVSLFGANGSVGWQPSTGLKFHSRPEAK